MSTPLLSIIVTTHDRPHTLIRTLRSVRANIPFPYEIIVLSDCMDPWKQNNLEGLLREGDSLHFVSNLRGPAQTRNMGIQLARGEFLILFDDDDEFSEAENGIIPLVQEALKNRGSLIYSDILIREEDRSSTPSQIHNEYILSLGNKSLNDIYVKNFIFTQACVIPTIFAKQCLQDHFLRSLEDWDFLLSLKSRCNFFYKNAIGAIIYKDFINQGIRRSTTDQARGFDIVLDYLYIYRRWPSPTPEIQLARSKLLGEHGLPVPPEFL